MKKDLMKMVGLIVALMLVLGMFAGCGVSNDNAKPTETTAEKTTVAAETTKEEVKPVDLKFLFFSEWDGENSKATDIKKQLELKFYIDNPNIKVTYEMLPAGENNKRLLTAHAAGGGDFDLIWVNNPDTTNYAKVGVIADLSEYMKTSALNADDFFQGFFNMCKVGDKIFALPFETDCRVLAYNKKLLVDANIQPPKTVDEFLAAAKALTKDGVYGFAEPMNKNNWVPIYDTSFMLFGDGGSFVVADGDKYKANLNTPEGIKFMERSRELYKYMPKDSMGYDYNKFNAAFAQGKVAMSVWGPWIYSAKEILDAKLDYGLTLLPAGNKNSSSTMGGWLLGVSGDSKNKDAAFKVAEFLVKPEVNAEVTGALSTSGEAFKYGKMKDERYKIFADQLKTAIVPFPAGFSASSQVADGFANDFAKVLLTNDRIEDITKSGNDAIQKAIDSVN